MVRHVLKRHQTKPEVPFTCRACGWVFNDILKAQQHIMAGNSAQHAAAVNRMGLLDENGAVLEGVDLLATLLIRGENPRPAVDQVNCYSLNDT